MKRLMMAVASVMTMGILFVSPAAAYNPSGYKWDDTVLHWCNTNLNTAQYNAVTAGLQQWNGIANISFAPRVYPYSCDVYLEIEDTSTNVAAQTQLSVISGEIVQATIRFDESITNASHFWWSSSVEDCNVHGTGSPCHINAYTVAMHEAGHVLGFEHNGSPYGSCDVHGPDSGGTAYYSTAFVSACDTLGERIMYQYAGVELSNCGHCGFFPHQGFRRHIDQNHQDGLVDIYGP
jgi:hypothetical protein